MNTMVRVRFAPSPTGYLTIGGARTALYNYLFAQQQEGKFILRIEDTDQERYVPDSLSDLMEGLRWLGLNWDEGPEVEGPYKPYIQTERTSIYQEFAQKLVNEGHAYYCFCSKERLESLRKEQEANKKPPRYDGLCRNLDSEEIKERIASGEPHVIRFKTPQEGTTKVYDIARGEISFENNTLDDFIIVKSNGLPVYHLAAMVDDGVMGVTHVIRGLEWLPSLPKHVLIIKALGFSEPKWLHLSLFLKPSGKGKMSKRDLESFKDSGHSIFIRDMDQLGYLPQAVLNWIVLMGWSLDDKTEILSLPEMVKGFSLDHVHASPAAINFEKLDYFNGYYIRALSELELQDKLKKYLQKYDTNYLQLIASDEEKFHQVVLLIRERIKRFDEFRVLTEYFFVEQVSVSKETIMEFIKEESILKNYLGVVLECVETLTDWGIATIDTKLHEIQLQLGLKPKDAFMTLRLVVSGQHATPPLFDMLNVMGREKVVTQIKRAYQMLT